MKPEIILRSSLQFEVDIHRLSLDAAVLRTSGNPNVALVTPQSRPCVLDQPVVMTPVCCTIPAHQNCMVQVCTAGR